MAGRQDLRGIGSVIPADEIISRFCQAVRKVFAHEALFGGHLAGGFSAVVFSAIGIPCDRDLCVPLGVDSRVAGGHKLVIIGLCLACLVKEEPGIGSIFIGIDRADAVSLGNIEGIAVGSGLVPVDILSSRPVVVGGALEVGHRDLIGLGLPSRVIGDVLCDGVRLFDGACELDILVPAQEDIAALLRCIFAVIDIIADVFAGFDLQNLPGRLRVRAEIAAAGIKGDLIGFCPAGVEGEVLCDLVGSVQDRPGVSGHCPALENVAAAGNGVAAGQVGRFI